MSSTPLLTRISERQDRRVGPLCPTPIQERMSPFAKRLRERNLDAKVLWNGAFVPMESDGAA